MKRGEEGVRVEGVLGRQGVQRKRWMDRMRDRIMSERGRERER